MSNTIQGQLTLASLIYLTNKNRKNRFEFMERDTLKNILIRKVKVLNPDRPNEPTYRYEFQSFSYPQYRPYTNNISRGASKQRKWKHQYNQILTVDADEKGKISLGTMNWKYRLGSEKKWQDKVPQKHVKSIYHETSRKWREEYEKEVAKIKRRNPRNKTDLLKKAHEKWKQKKIDHKKKAPYLDNSDFNSRVNGINGDATFRVHGVFQYYGHLYGKNVEQTSSNVLKPFAPKHLLRLLNFLIKKGILQ